VAITGDFPMPQSFSYDVSLAESPDKAHARVRDIVTEQVLKSAEMSPCLEGPASMAFRPKLGWPLMMTATRRIRGENINLEFQPSDLGTTVAVSGKVAGHADVASREFWTKTLTAA
jgi:hypothetical protein